jgi:hypothetical protein
MSSFSFVAILNKQKCYFFSLSFAKLEIRRAEQVLSGDRSDTSGSGEKVGKGYKRVWCKYCVYMNVNRKKIPVETVPGTGRRG